MKLKTLTDGELIQATVDAVRNTAKAHYTLKELVCEAVRRKFTTANIVQWCDNAGLIGTDKGQVTKAWCETVVSRVRTETGNNIKPGSGRNIKPERKDKADALIAYCTGPLEVALKDVPRFLYATARVAAKLAKQAEKSDK